MSRGNTQEPKQKLKPLRIVSGGQDEEEAYMSSPAIPAKQLQWPNLSMTIPTQASYQSSLAALLVHQQKQKAY